ncbi:MAG TPA: universal stress protein [Saprospiraceae bacterium]|nr:universal stress protein [Saprospiraceae bacterium]
MKKILYPTDFSATAENAFIYALQIADTLGASVITLHAFDRPDISNFNLPGVLREVYDSIDLDEFENYEDEIPLLRDIASDNGYYHVPMVHVLEEGAPVSAILRTANKNKADLIVMGATGAGRMEAFFFGTISGKVLEEAHCPVIIVPEDAKFDGLIDHIAVAINFKPEDTMLIEALRKFRDLIGSQIHILHVDTDAAAGSQDKMNAFCEAWHGDKRISTHCIQHKDINHVLGTFMRENNMDLLALLSHKRSWVDEIFHRNRAKTLSDDHSFPVMVYQLENLMGTSKQNHNNTATP